MYVVWKNDASGHKVIGVTRNEERAKQEVEDVMINGHDTLTFATYYDVPELI